jgi:putative transposase
LAQKKNRTLSNEQKRSLIEPENEQISISAQCRLLDIERSIYYYKPVGESLLNLDIMRKLDEQYTATPFYGVIRMTHFIRSLGYEIDDKRIRRLLRLMGIMAIYPKKKTSIPNIEHRIYPYLLKGLKIDRPNQVWSTDITYIPMEKGFLYLVAVIDWYSRYVVSWQISNTMETSFCIDALQAALSKGQPEIFNTDQGSQFTSNDFTKCLLENKIQISMDGKGRCMDNIFVERLWRSVKYEYVYLNSIPDGKALWHGLDNYFRFYNQERFHQGLDNKTPRQVYLN